MAKKIGLIDADLFDNGTRHPNLALMKIAGYHLEQGDSVELLLDGYVRITEYETVYISKVFSFTTTPEYIERLPNVIIGGTGFFADGGKNLPNEIEHHMPFYGLYDDYVKQQLLLGKKNISKYNDYLNFSIGFTTRGCFRKCSFCVNKKYDHAFRHSPINEFLDINRKGIYLWDDNILAYPKWNDVFDELIATGKPFQFRQGIDLRLMTDEKAKVLNKAKYYGDFIFAFDNIIDKDLIIEKIQLWKRYTSKTPKLYVLVAFASQDAVDIRNAFERIKILMSYGCIPYIMRYNEYKNSELKDMYIQLARWCNQPQFFKKQSFREYCIANRDYQLRNPKSIKENKTYLTMQRFEAMYPEVALEYFDMKYEEMNIYKSNYPKIKQYRNKPECKFCKQKSLNWDSLIMNQSLSLQKFFRNEVDFGCLNYSNKECFLEYSDLVGKIFEYIKMIEIEELKILLDIFDEDLKSSRKLSKLISLITILESNNNLVRDEATKKTIDELLFLDLIKFDKLSGYTISNFGSLFLKLDKVERQDFLSKLLLKGRFIYSDSL